MKELSKLPEGVRAQAEEVVFEALICENPFNLGCLEQMRGFPGKYKIRIGDYRIGVTINKRKKEIVCLDLYDINGNLVYQSKDKDIGTFSAGRGLVWAL